MLILPLSEFPAHLPVHPVLPILAHQLPVRPNHVGILILCLIQYHGLIRGVLLDATTRVDVVVPPLSVPISVVVNRNVVAINRS